MMNIPLTNTSVSADFSDQSTEARCRIATGTNEPCAPPHKMKYYTQVRVYTNDGKVGMAISSQYLGNYYRMHYHSTWMTFLVRFVNIRSELESIVATNPNIRMPLQD